MGSNKLNLTELGRIHSDRGWRHQKKLFTGI